MTVYPITWACNVLWFCHILIMSRLNKCQNFYNMPKIYLSFVIFFLCFQFMAKSQSTKSIDSLKKVLQTEINDTSKIDLMLLLMRKFSEAHIKDSFLIYSKEALAVAQKINDVKRVGNVYFSICNAYQLFGDYALSTENNEIARGYYEKANFPIGVLRCKMRLLGLYYSMDEHSKVANLFGIVYQEALKLEDTKTQMGLLFYNTMSLFFMKKYDSAFFYAHKYYTEVSTIKDINQLNYAKMILSNIAPFIKNINLRYYVTMAMEAKSYFMQQNNKYATIDASTSLVQLFNATNKYNLANKELNDIKADLDLSDTNSFAVNYFEQKYISDSLQGNYKDAFSNLVKFNLYQNVLDTKSNLIKANTLQSSYDLAEAKRKNMQLENEKLMAKKEVMQQRIILTSLLASTVLLFGFFFYKRWQQNKRRAIEAENLKVQTELKFLKTQLDPHFIQNTFQVLANKLQSQNTDEAINVLKTVSNYLRGVLSQSDKQLVTLEEELEFTEQYLNLTRSLAKQPFTFSINIADDADTFGTILPVMLLQPIVENSVKHGFANGTLSGGKITVDVKNSNDCIIILIGDNGQGGNCQNKASGNSKGIQLTQERLNLIYNKANNKPIVQSMFNQDGFSYATKISLPLILS